MTLQTRETNNESVITAYKNKSRRYGKHAHLAIVTWTGDGAQEGVGRATAGKERLVTIDTPCINERKTSLLEKTENIVSGIGKTG
jgi:hypothetical protein